MKILTGWAATAALVLAVTGANGQVPSDGMRTRYMPVSDLEGAYAPEVPAPRHGYRSGYGYDRGPALLPSEEVYAVLRENGFSPLGIPRLRGVVYTIAAIDRRGDDGRLVIDARDGRIVRFIPADRWGPPVEDDARTPYLGPYGTQGALPAPEAVRAAPRPPAPIPRVASRTVPLPKAAPVRGEVAAAPAPSAPAPQPSAAARARPQEATAVPQAAAPTVGQARPAPTILPTQDMPPALGLD
ncbi:MAG: hypothetical protein HY852_23440 [Bradyrhizobium sp.]|uniref:hypothetical protein n=1 Tax=Bradyrhizobium sp. TaxID=376 RepID=UPI0025C50701|nr:hypothetical protein [Bradyrhizobium sp.]MBI5264760.1 hypothetical protein [Bradyrhizobium sp.]